MRGQLQRRAGISLGRDLKGETAQGCARRATLIAKTGQSRPIVFLLLTLLLMPSSSANSADTARSIEAELRRLQQSLKANPITHPDLTPIASMIDAALLDARRALSAGRIYLSLERLAQVEDWFCGARSVAEKSDMVKDKMRGFAGEWERTRLELASFDDKIGHRDWGQTSAALRAISETSHQRAIPLLEGGRGFATSEKPTDGLFYIGEARGEARFAAFVSSLRVPPTAGAVPLRSLLPELQKLQEKANTAFQPPRSIELHSRFIALNSTLKLAGELDSAKAYAGALYQYLEAIWHYGLLDNAAPDYAKLGDLKRAVAGAERQLRTSSRDDSIAQIFLERAQSQMNHGDGSPPNADEFRSAKVIVEQVLPAYFEALKPGGVLPRSIPKTIHITLVRWPYT